MERRQLEVVGIEAVLPEYALVVGRVNGCITQHLPETLVLARLQGFERQPLRALELTQDAKPPAPVLEVPQGMEHVPRHRAHERHDRLYPVRGCHNTCFSPRRKRSNATAEAQLRSRK